MYAMLTPFLFTRRAVHQILKETLKAKETANWYKQKRMNYLAKVSVEVLSFERLSLLRTRFGTSVSFLGDRFHVFLSLENLGLGYSSFRDSASRVPSNQPTLR